MEGFRGVIIKSLILSPPYKIPLISPDEPIKYLLYDIFVDRQYILSLGNIWEKYTVKQVFVPPTISTNISSEIPLEIHAI